ncbi:MAG: copper homeostasis protein CutC [Saprospiraceae bacterium]
MKETFLELCCADLHSVVMAAQYPVDGIELCVDLTSGGLTPTAGSIRFARKMFKGELAVMVRPRKGDFRYDNLDISILLEDIRIARGEGADAIVFGALDEHGLPDQSLIEQVLEVSGGSTLCFHKIIDLSQDMMRSQEILMDFQIDRMLSGGGAKTAREGAAQLKKMVDLSAGRITIMAGGSIDASNVLPLIEQSCVERIHGALMTRPAGLLPEYGVSEITSEDKLKDILVTLGKI